MPLIPNLSLYLIQKFDRLALGGNLTILELHYAETQAKFIAFYDSIFMHIFMCFQMINSPFYVTKYEKYIEIILLSRSVFII